MRFSAKTFALSALSALLISPSLQAEELEPPNVSIYADVMLSMAQTKRLTYHSDDGKGVYHHGETDGYRARVGLRFDDMSHGFWSYGIEGSLVQLANNNKLLNYDREPQTDESNISNLATVKVDGEHSLELSGFEFAGRVWYDDTMYFRAGMLIYNEKTRLRETRQFYDTHGNSAANTTTTFATDTKRRAAPMLGVGIQYPIIEGIYLAGEYTFYRMNSKQVDVLSAGVRLVF